MRKLIVLALVGVGALLLVTSGALAVKPKPGTKYKGATGMDCIAVSKVSFKVAANGKAINRFHTNRACIACKQQAGLQTHTRRAPFTMSSIPLAHGSFSRTRTYVLRTIPWGAVQSAHAIKPKTMHVVIGVEIKFQKVNGKIEASGFIFTHELRKVHGKYTKHGCATVPDSFFASPA